MFGTGGNEAGTFTLNRYIWGAVEADHCIFFTNYSHNIHAITFTKEKKNQKQMIILVHQEGRRLFTRSSVQRAGFGQVFTALSVWQLISKSD